MHCLCLLGIMASNLLPLWVHIHILPYFLVVKSRSILEEQPCLCWNYNVRICIGGYDFSFPKSRYFPISLRFLLDQLAIGNIPNDNCMMGILRSSRSQNCRQ